MTRITTQTIAYPSNDHTTPGYLAAPTDGEGHPAIVTIQEWWGLVPHIRDIAERFARHGFVALAPDLYHGKTAAEPDEARKLAMSLDRSQAVEEIRAAARFLRSRKDVAPKKIGVVGWCMGGALALSTAAEDESLGAVVVFYGRPLDPGDTGKIQAPVLGLYGENDQGIPVADVKAFADALAATQVTHEVHIYPEAGHAFFNNTRPQAFHPEAAEDAWERTLGWFRKYLLSEN